MSALRTLILLALMNVCSSQTPDCSYSGLLNYLNLTSTNSVLEMVRPVKNWTVPTTVMVDMLLYGILDVDEKSQTITGHIWFQLQWKNEFLTWNSSDFCGINMLTIPRSRVWIPDIQILEDASDTGSTLHNPFVALVPNGLVYTNGRQRLTFTCQLNLYLFPFDIQHCTITFSPMTYRTNGMNLGRINNDTTLTSVSEDIMITHGEWQLQSIKVLVYNYTKANGSSSKLEYIVTIIRKPTLYVINLIVPLFLFLILDLASFFISEAGGEKLGFKVTLLLSISVLLLILQEMLPSTENNLPMMAQYCASVFALLGISVLEAILVSYLPELDALSKKAHGSAKTQKELEGGDRRDAGEDGGKGRVDLVPLDGASDHNLLRQILEEVKAARQEAGREDGEGPGFYRRLAGIIDCVFFVLYFASVLIVLAYFGTVWCKNCFSHERD